MADMRKYFCNPCGYTYDPEKGDPEHGIAPGTPFEALPDDWVCPVCGIDKSMFQPCINNYNQNKKFKGMPDSAYPSDCRQSGSGIYIPEPFFFYQTNCVQNRNFVCFSSLQQPPFCLDLC